jgi:hypothetical protein
MDRVFMFVILLLSILTMSSKSYSQDEFPALKGPYLGQTSPGLTAKPFAPGIALTNRGADPNSQPLKLKFTLQQLSANLR